jgi:CHAT domain-containing protein/Tfp pilus assembly protein PilF
VAQLESAATEQERNSLLEKNPELINADLEKALLNEASSLRFKSSSDKALAVSDLAKLVSEKLNDTNGIIDSLNIIASLISGNGDYDLALAKYEEALKMSEAAGYTRGKADTLVWMAVPQHRKGNMDAAMKSAQESLKIYENLNDKSGIARAQHIMGLIYEDTGDWQTALDLYQKSLQLRQELSETLNIGHLYLSIGSVIWNSRMDLAQDYFQKAADIFQKEGDKRKLASAYNNLAILLTYRGNHSLALQYYLRGMELAQEVGWKSGIAHSLLNIGVLYEAQDNYDLAMDYFNRSLKMSEELGETGLISYVLDAAAGIDALNGKYQKALDEYDKTLALSKESGLPPEDIYWQVAYVHQLMGNYKLAHEYYQKSLDGYDLSHERAKLAFLLPHLANLKYHEKDYQGALETAKHAYEVGKEIDFQGVLWSSKLEEGRAYLALKDTENAKQALETSIAEIEKSWKIVVGNEVESQQFFEKQTEPYAMLIDLLLLENKNAEAFAYAERSRARVLFDVLKGGKVQVTKNMTEQERNEEQMLLTSLQKLNEELLQEKSRPDSKKVPEIEKKLQDARFAYESFRTNLYAIHPELKLQRGEFETAGPEKSADILENSEVVLEYAVSDNQTHLFVQTKTDDSTSLQTYSIPIQAADLSSHINTFRKALADRDPSFGTMATQLYRELVKPAEKDLKGKSHIIIVPDQELWELPFQALQTDQGKYVLEKYSVSYAPSLTVLAEMVRSERNAENQKALLAMGNPTIGVEIADRVKAINRGVQLGTMPEAEDEVRSIAHFYDAKNSRVLIRNNASEDTLKLESHDFGIIHIAAHGILNDSSPMYSNVALARGKDQTQDGLLEAWEVMNMDLNASMVVLSACETARGKVGAGEGMIGLSWAFFVAGVPSVVVSQWNVNSESTTKLMEEFHKQWRTSKSHLTKADALRSAALTVMQNPRYSHPHYWASFVVVGDPR